MVNKKSGFTMIELVVVIVILGILAAVALPTFYNLQSDARRSAVRGSLGGMRSGVAMYYAATAASGTAVFPSVAQLPSTLQFNVPANPYTGSTSIVAGAAEATNTAAGWIYDATTGKVWSSAAETQNSGY